MTGNIFEHVAHSGRGFPSASLGMSGGLGGSLTSEAQVTAPGRVRSILGGSLSSFFTLTSPLNALTRDGVGVCAGGVIEAFSLPFPLASALVVAATIKVDTERVTRFFGGETVAGCTAGVVEGGEGTGTVELTDWLVRACSSACRF